MTRNTRLICCLLSVACCVFISCENNRLDVDASVVNVDPVKIQRFDRDFFSLNADNISQEFPALQKKYSGFTDLFLRNIICTLGVNDSSCVPEIIKFVHDKDMQSAYDECQKKFSDMTDIESGLTEVMRHHKYYFPEKKLPEIVAMMSGFNYAIESSTPAIGLEMYLGNKNGFYDMMRIPNYKRATMQKEYIIPDLVRAWMIDQFPNKSKSGTLLSEMIYQGKLLYLSDAMVPDAEDTLKIGFTNKQLVWCVEHEN